MQTRTTVTQNTDQGLKHSTLSVVSGLVLAAAVGSAALLFTPVSASSPASQAKAVTMTGIADDSLHQTPGFAVTGEVDLSHLGSSVATQ